MGDTYCNNKLTAPSCWEEFSESVWKPTNWKNLVSRKEGQDLYFCVQKCGWANTGNDFIGKSYEEKREKREEFREVGTGGDISSSRDNSIIFIKDLIKINV